ncbi:protein tyrosine phosphatase [Mycobacterium leprae]|uniref:protein-tyrosine-phosphatase n=1 Tax=Mycobacterium leprae TaxID=1769 RepID=A0AAD0KSM9_MYCLR|nr:protein tyrosine phosphatase [Mycobacterium leprae]
MFADQLRQCSLGDAMLVISAGTGNSPVSDGADARVTRGSCAPMATPTDQCTAQVNADHLLSADLVVSLSRNHVVMLRQPGIENSRIRMLRSFDPSSGAYALDVEDPYYGDHDDFEEVFAVIETALPGLHDWLDERLAQNGHS